MTARDLQRKLYRRTMYEMAPLFMGHEVTTRLGVSDFVVVRKSMLWHEWETKISMSDLRAEAKKEKHQFFSDPVYQERGDIPNYFCFCVTEQMHEEAREYVRERFPLAGLWFVRDGQWPWRNEFECVLPVRRIHKHKLPESLLNNMFRSICFRHANIILNGKSAIPIHD